MPLPAPDADEMIPANLQALTRYMQQEDDDQWWKQVAQAPGPELPTDL